MGFSSLIPRMVVFQYKLCSSLPRVKVVYVDNKSQKRKKQRTGRTKKHNMHYFKMSVVDYEGTQ